MPTFRFNLTGPELPIFRFDRTIMRFGNPPFSGEICQNLSLVCLPLVGREMFEALKAFLCKG